MPETAWTMPALRLELDDEVLDAQEHVVAEVRGAGAGHQASLPASASTSSARELDLLGGDGVAGDGRLGGGHVVGQVALERLAAGVGAHRVPAAVHVAGRLGLDERRLLGVAARLRVGAARREPAARRRVDEVRRAPADDLEARVARVLELRDRLEQRLGVRHPHVGEQRPRGRLLHDLAGVHHGDLVGAAGDDAEVVGDEDHRHVAVALLVGEQVEDLGLDGDVERGGGLVGEEQLRAAGQRDGDRDALAHAAGQLVGVLA